MNERTLISPGPHGCYFEAPGTIIGFGERYGSPSSSQHVLFLPGEYQSTSCWRHQVEALAKQGCYVVVIDVPGQGLASAPIDPYTGIAADYLAAAIDVYELETPHLIAWSFGCLLAMDMLLAGPEDTLRSVVFVGPAAPVVWKPEALQPLLQAYPWMQQLLSPNKETRLAIAPQFVQMLFGSPVGALDYDLAYGSTVRNLSCSGPPEALLYHLTPEPMMVQQKLASVSLTILYGILDPFVLLPVIQSFRLLVPHLREVVLSGCGHSPHIERPQSFNHHLFAAIGMPSENGVCTAKGTNNR